jgi:hypothetical protein
MAILNRASKISARPQLKAVKQPIPRQVILPKKAPAKASGIARPTNVTPRQNVPVSPAEAQRIMNMQKPPSIPLMAQPLPSLYQSMQNQITNLTNPLYNSNPQTNEPAPAPVNYESYGFDKGLVDYLNNQKQMSYTDGGVSYNYDPATQTFTGGTRGGPVTMTLAEMQAQAQNYNPMGGGQFETNPMANPMYNAPDINNPLFAGFSAPNPMANPMYNAPDINNPLFAGFSAPNPMANPMYNAPDVNNPLFAGYSAPMPNNMNQQGFVPMGGNNPQNTSYGSFGAIQQPMGGYGNIGSLLGKG